MERMDKEIKGNKVAHVKPMDSMSCQALIFTLCSLISLRDEENEQESKEFFKKERTIEGTSMRTRGNH